jgi:hypothetical protein
MSAPELAISPSMSARPNASSMFGLFCCTAQSRHTPLNAEPRMIGQPVTPSRSIGKSM